MQSQFRSPQLGALLTALALAACGDSTEPHPPIPTTGTLRISTSTAGVDPDPDGYSLLIDALTPIAIGSNNAQSVAVAPGTYQVLLDGIAANCVLTVPGPVEVSAGLVVDVSLNVSCTPFLTDLTVTVQSNGEDPDPGGYRVLLDDQAIGRVPYTGALPLRIPHGQHRIALEEVASNCSFTSAASVEMNIPADQATEVPFALSCVHSPKLAFMHGGNVFSMNPDGTGLSQLSPHWLGGIRPDWSPDGRRLLFTSLTPLQIWLTNPDGTGLRQVQFGGLDALQAAWSPDGGRLAVSLRIAPDTVALFVSDTNGEGLKRVSFDGTFETDLAWSPAGDQIAFSRTAPNSTRRLFLAHADGSGVTPLTDATDDRGPSWSPDGSRIAFTGQGPTGERRVYLMNPDGSNRTSLQPLDQRIWATDVRWMGNSSSVIMTDGLRVFQVDAATGQEVWSTPAELSLTMISWRN